MSEKYRIYLAVFVSECSVERPGFKIDYPQQENFLLIKASSVEKAEQKAAKEANRANHSYKNQYGETVTWTLNEIVMVEDLMLEEEIDLHSDVVDFYARGIIDYEAYKLFHGVTRD